MPTELQEIKEILRDVAEKFRDTDLKFRDTDMKFRDTDLKIKKAFDLFETQWGKLMESLVEGDIVNLLRSKGIEVHDTSMRRKGSHQGQNFEFDIIAHNGNEIVIVEVKTTLRPDDVKEFVEKLKHAKEWLGEYKNYNIYGAVAFLQANSGSEVLAENKKLFVIKATGNSAQIINKPGFKPRSF